MPASPILLDTTTPNGIPAGQVGLLLPITANYAVVRALLLAKGTRTGGVAGSFTGRIWLYDADSADWYPAGIGAVADAKGSINGGDPVTETSASTIRHAEIIDGLLGIERLYFQLLTATNLSALTLYLSGIQTSRIGD